MDDFYTLLGVEQDATHGELRRAWRSLQETWQPGSPALFSLYSADEVRAIRGRLEEAWQVLSHPERRRRYDCYRAMMEQPESIPTDLGRFFDTVQRSLDRPLLKRLVEQAHEQVRRDLSGAINEDVRRVALSTDSQLPAPGAGPVAVASRISAEVEAELSAAVEAEISASSVLSLDPGPEAEPEEPQEPATAAAPAAQRAARRAPRDELASGQWALQLVHTLEQVEALSDGDTDESAVSSLYGLSVESDLPPVQTDPGPEDEEPPAPLEPDQIAQLAARQGYGGAFLATVRQLQRLTPNQLARAARISRAQLEAIEADSISDSADRVRALVTRVTRVLRLEDESRVVEGYLRRLRGQ